MKKEDLSRAAYCKHFTNMPWGLAAHYGMTLHTSDYGIENSVEMIMAALEQAKDYMDKVEESGQIPVSNFVKDVEELTD